MQICQQKYRVYRIAASIFKWKCLPCWCDYSVAAAAAAVVVGWILIGFWPKLGYKHCYGQLLLSCHVNVYRPNGGGNPKSRTMQRKDTEKNQYTCHGIQRMSLLSVRPNTNIHKYTKSQIQIRFQRTHVHARTHATKQIYTISITKQKQKQNQIGVLPVSLCMNRKTKSKKQKLKCSSQYVQFKWTTYSSWDSNLMITAVFVVVCFCWKLISSHIFIKWLNAFKLLLIFFRVRQIFFSSFQIHYLSSLHFDAMKCQCTGNATQSFMLHK